MIPTILAVAGDAGGATALAPVLRHLDAERKVEVVARPYREAIALWAPEPFNSVPIGEPEAISAALSNTSLLLVGTSVNDLDYEKACIKAARQAGRPSLAVLDYWCAYAKRFADTSGQLPYLPDRIAVMDELARQGMLAEGIPDDRIDITGQPALDDLAQVRQRFTTHHRTAIRHSLGVTSDQTLILFASQPLAELYGCHPSNPKYLGYTEKTVVQDLITSLDSLATDGMKITLVVRPHPREKTAPVSPVTTEKGVRVVLDRKTDKQALMLSSDMVTGMDSMLLVESCYLGCPTVSLQPGLIKADNLPTNRNGLSKPVYQREQITSVLKSTLAQKPTGPQQNPENATLNIVRQVYRMLFPNNSSFFRLNAK